MSEYCIELNNVTKTFGKFTAVDNVNIKLEPGKVYGFVGPNGAGKSTTMAIIMGTLFPTKGNGKVFGHPLASPEALKVLGYSPEFTSFYSDMNCIEYLYYMATLAGLSSDEAIKRTNELLDQFDLKQHANRRVAKFSTGMKKKVSLAQAMIHRPKVLLLDEPTANLDPTSRQEILDTVRKMVEEEHLTVLISSHVLTELETIINHVIMIDHGHIILDAPIHEAQEKFKQGILMVDTSNNDQLLSELNGRYEYTLEEGNIRFATVEMEQLKKDIVSIVFNSQLTLNMLKEEVLSLDSLYKQIMEGEKSDEGNIQKNA
ncbi:MAG: ABC transporter ATP-binding protein [Erysipelotrichaceae bacterium]|nr:ABC transporter ATP-binding protein [Erysipelotrichaceae bacterium]